MSSDPSNNSVDMTDLDECEDAAEFLDASDMREVIEIDDETDMDEVADRLMDAMGGDDSEEEEVGPAHSALTAFAGHTGSVFSCCLSRCGQFAVTGGEDDTAYVWNTSDASVIMQCHGHKDSVTQVCFSSDAQLVATADLSGLVQVWQISDKSLCFTYETNDINWLSWVEGSHQLVCGTASEGLLWLWNIDTFPAGTDTFPGYGSSVTAASVTPDGKRIVVGYEDGKIRTLQLFKSSSDYFSYSNKSNKSSQKGSSKGGGSRGVVVVDGQHAAEVTSVATHPDNVVAITGATNGTALLINTCSGKILHSIDLRADRGSSSSSEEDGRSLSVECVGFCTARPSLAVIGCVDGTVAVYDIAAKVKRFTVEQPAGVSRLCFPASSTRVIVAGLDGVCRTYDVLSGQLLCRYVGHEKDVLDLACDRSGEHLLTSSDDGTARVFNMQD